MQSALFRLVYTLIWLIATPLVAVRLAWRGRRQPEYRQHLAERLGRYGAVDAGAPWLWLHAVSVGETRAAEPLVRAMLAQWPAQRLLVTVMTPTGRATATQLFTHEIAAGRLRVVYLPYDAPALTRRFLAHFAPRCGVIMETELWPGLLDAAARADVPMVLVNARLSARSARGYARFGSLTRTMLASLAAVAAQDDADAARLAALGAPTPTVTGNIKFDITPPAAQLALAATFRAACGTRPVVVLASSREGEEALALAAWTAAERDDALLVIVPRHPQRVEEVAALIARHGLACSRRSQRLPDAGSAVWLGDSMGEMFAYYAAADVALIGGSWLPFGGQNLIEACAVGTPVLLGPHTFNFARIAEDALASGAARRATDMHEGISRAQALLHDRAARTHMAAAGTAFAAQHRGATARTLAVLMAQRDR